MWSVHGCASKTSLHPTAHYGRTIQLPCMIFSSPLCSVLNRGRMSSLNCTAPKTLANPSESSRWYQLYFILVESGEQPEVKDTSNIFLPSLVFKFISKAMSSSSNSISKILESGLSGSGNVTWWISHIRVYGSVNVISGETVTVARGFCVLFLLSFSSCVMTSFFTVVDCFLSVINVVNNNTVRPPIVGATVLMPGLGVDVFCSFC